MFKVNRSLCLHWRFFMGLPIMAVVLAATPACTNFLPSHIHDAAAEKTAVELQTELAQYREEQSGLYDSMAANLAKFHVEEDELVNKIAGDYTIALVTKAPDFNWTNLFENLDKVDSRAKKLHAQILKKLKEDLAERNVATANISEANQAIKKLKKEIEKQKKEEEKWQKASKRYREALSKLPSTIEGLTEKATDISKLLTEVESLDLNTLEELENREIDPGEFLKVIADTNASLRQQVSDALTEAPGITVPILELGAELTELDKRRAESILETLEARRKIFEESLVHVDIVEAFSKEGRNLITSADYTRALIDEIELERANTITSDGKQKTTPTNIKSVSNILLALELSISSEWIIEYQEAVFALRLNRIEHSESITQSQVNDEAWQAMIKSGVDALVAYHKGGLKRDDLANFFRLAQSIALIIISA